MATQQQELITLGKQMFLLVNGVVAGRSVHDETAMVQVGKEIHSLIAATVKASLPGRQTEENTKELQQAAQKAFARKLTRKVSKL